MSNRQQRRRKKADRSETTATPPIDSKLRPRIIASDQWWGIAFVVGPALPDHVLAITPYRPDVRKLQIGQLRDDERIKYAGSNRRPSPISGLSHAFQIGAPEVLVDSCYTVRWEYEAVGEEAAHDKVAAELLPELEAVLCLLDRDRYYFEFARYGPLVLGGRGEMKGPWRYSPAFSSPPFAPMVQEHTTAIATNLRLYRESPAVQKVLHLLREAERADRFRLSEPTLAIAALNHFHLAIEAVIDETAGPPDSTDVDPMRQDVVSDVTRLLAASDSLATSTSAIHRADQALRALAATSFLARAGRAVNRLGLESPVGDDIREFYKFRNDYLGHPNKVLGPQTAATWANRARMLAWTMVTAFVDYSGGQLVVVEPERQAKPGAFGNVTVPLPGQEIKVS